MAHVLAKELRDAVLQAAIQGKLTERIVSDTSVEVTLKNIAEERQELAKGKQSKKKNWFHLINDEEFPFDIPEKWMFVRLSDICSKIVDGDHNPPAGVDYKTKYRMLSAINISSSGLTSLDNCRFLDEQTFLKENERTLLEKEDILITIVGTLGRCCIYRESESYAFQRSVAVIRTYINNDYLKNVIDSPYIQAFMTKNATGTAQKGFYLKPLSNLFIPLPPLEEQQRIVDRVDELMAKIDEYEKLENQLVQLKEQFPKDMRDSLLQAGMMGRLTNQLTSDTSVETTLESIEREKRQLIKDKKIKKEKRLPLINDEEIPHDIPDTWQWVRMGDVIDCAAGSTPLKTVPAYYENGTVKWLLTGDLNDSYIYDCKKRITEYALEKCSFRLNHENDILIAMYGATIGKLGICKTDFVTNQACLGCTPFKGLLYKYLFYVLKAEKANLIDKAEGGAQPNISRIKIRNHLMPFPPIEEQQRIVDKLDEMLPLVDSLAQMN